MLTHAPVPLEYNYLVLDVDSCSLTCCTAKTINGETKLESNPRNDILSQDVIDEGLKVENGKRKYAGFYICTARYSKTASFPFWDKTLGTYRTFLKRDFDITNLLITTVKANLEKALGIPCVGVATPDDLSKTAPKELHLKVGYGFENLTKEIEWSLFELNENKIEKIFALDHNTIKELPKSERDQIIKEFYTGYNLAHDFDFTQNGKHKSHEYAHGERIEKNPLLTNIGHHASARHADGIVNLHYMDDERDRCEKACDELSETLPCNIQFRATHHHAERNITEPVGKPIKGKAPIPKPVALSPIGIEAKPTHQPTQSVLASFGIEEKPKPELPSASHAKPAAEPPKVSQVSYFSRKRKRQETEPLLDQEDRDSCLDRNSCGRGGCVIL